MICICMADSLCCTRNIVKQLYTNKNQLKINKSITSIQQLLIHHPIQGEFNPILLIMSNWTHTCAMWIRYIWPHSLSSKEWRLENQWSKPQRVHLFMVFCREKKKQCWKSYWINNLFKKKKKPQKTEMKFKQADLRRSSHFEKVRGREWQGIWKQTSCENGKVGWRKAGYRWLHRFKRLEQSLVTH